MTRVSQSSHDIYSVQVVGHRIRSSDLLGSERELIIEHHDDVYRLRITANNKLILTK